MPDPSEPPNSNVNQPLPSAIVPSTDELQFDRAEVAAPVGGRICVACKQATGARYYQVQGKTVCERCAKALEGRVRSAPASSLGTAALYGLGAAAAGCAMYAAVEMVFHLQLALVAILVGYMVGRAVRYGSKGLGGRPQQILAAVLTYFAVSSSYVVIVAYSSRNDLIAMILPMLLFVVAGPFLAVANHPNAVLSLVIIFFGVWRAWKMTGRPNVVITGPYSEAA